jgi:hypothetical protein
MDPWFCWQYRLLEHSPCRVVGSVSWINVGLGTEHQRIVVWCYSNSKTVIKLLYEPINKWHHYVAIIYNIQDLLAREWRVKVVHTLRESNDCADFLAKLGTNNPKAYSRIATPPAGMSLHLLAS